MKQNYQTIMTPIFSKNNFYGYFYKMLIYCDLQYKYFSDFEEKPTDILFTVEDIVNLSGVQRRIIYDFVHECREQGILIKDSALGDRTYIFNKDYLIMRRDNV